jgi:hypothetical protein
MIENAFQSAGDPESGYWLNFSPSEHEVQHEFCGEHNIAGAMCPNCKKPLLRLLSLNAEDPALNLDKSKTPLIHLLYCWTCALPYGEFNYKINPDGSIELLNVLDRYEWAFGADGPYDGYVGRFPPLKVSLEPQSRIELEKLAARFASDSEAGSYDGFWEPRHHIGGYPFISNPEKLNCPICSKEMPTLAAICDSAVDNNPWQDEPSNSFAGKGGGQMVFQFCRKCSVISSYQSND